MHVVEKSSGSKVDVEVLRVKNSELKAIKKSKQFVFDWEEPEEGEIYKLVLKGTTEIIGLMHIVVRSDSDFRCVEVISIEKRKEAVGIPGYENVAGCLFAVAAREATKHGLRGFLFLIAKTKSAELFHGKYGFDYISGRYSQGVRMASETENSNELMRKYLS